jgi:signal transduction histidine kinase
MKLRPQTGQPRERMAADVVPPQHERPSGPAVRGERRVPNLFLASVLEQVRDEILRRYATELRAITGSLSYRCDLHELCLSDAGRLLDDIIATSRGGGDAAASLMATPTSSAEASPLLDELHPSDLARLGIAFFHVAYDTVSGYTAGDPCAVELLTAAGLLLNKCVMARQREILAAYGRRQLHDIQAARDEERRHLSRELHDRIGHGLTVTAQSLDLHDMYVGRDPELARKKITIARESASELLRNLRKITSDLRVPAQPETLHVALTNFANVACPDGASVDIAINGDEAWMSPVCLDELFLVMREALTNAFRHARPSRVNVRIDIVPHLARAIVEDDGVGFDNAREPASAAGLASMRERVELLGGTMSLASAPGSGTSVEVIVPLRDEVR